MRRTEYGGYMEFERYGGEDIHKGAVALNCGRNCLAFLIRARQISRIHIPYFLCSSVCRVCEKYGVEVIYYHTDLFLRPVIEVEPRENEWLYLVNYYGQLDNETIGKYSKVFPNLIVDNAQAYFQPPVKGIDTLYTCRKFFGVADGAYLYTDADQIGNIEIDYSFDRMHYLLGRFEKGAKEFYPEYVANNRNFGDSSILRMSELTQNLLRGISYSEVRYTRKLNFQAFHTLLGDKNLLTLQIPEGAFMYPLYLRNGAEVRKKLQNERIYIPILWPGVFEICTPEDQEYDMALNILPIPVDQRYGVEDMLFLAKEVLQCAF